MVERRFEPLPPRAAIDALQARGLKLDPAFSWLDVWQELNANSFTVAKSAGFDILDDIYNALLHALSEGKTFRDFTAELTGVLQKKGWWGKRLVEDPLTGDMIASQLGSVKRLELIFDVNMRVSYAAGHWRNFEVNKSSRPFLRYVALLDKRTRPLHAAHHNLVLPVDHPHWQHWGPPNGWNCRCTLQSLSQHDVDEFQAKGVKLKFEPPVVPMRQFVNKRTGEVSQVPEGIDPGWAYNPGKAGYDAVVAADLERKQASSAWASEPDTG